MDSDRLRQLLANPIFPVWGPRELAMISSNVGHGQPSAPLSRGYYDEIGGDYRVSGCYDSLDRTAFLNATGDNHPDFEDISGFTGLAFSVWVRHEWDGEGKKGYAKLICHYFFLSGS